MISRKLFCLGVALAAASALFAAPTMAQDAGSGQLKSAIVFNILRFVDLPTAAGNRTLELCIKRGTGGDFSSLSGRSVTSRSIDLRMIEATSDADGCDVVYLGIANGNDVARIKRRGVLIIGDGSGFLRAGGAIGLVTTGKQTRFEVSMRAARQANIKISSQLLRLASRVDQ